MTTFDHDLYQLHYIGCNGIPCSMECLGIVFPRSGRSRVCKLLVILVGNPWLRHSSLTVCTIMLQHLCVNNIASVHTSELTILKKSQNMPVSLTEKTDSPELRILQMQEYISGNHGNLISIQAQVLRLQNIGTFMSFIKV